MFKVCSSVSIANFEHVIAGGIRRLCNSSSSQLEFCFSGLLLKRTCSKSIMGTPEQCEICSKVTIKTPKRRLRRSSVVIVIFEQISHILVFPLFTLNKYVPVWRCLIHFVQVDTVQTIYYL